MTAAEPAAGPPAGGELELQRRWAAGDWDGPWLEAGGEPARVAFAGTWNRGAGPDFRGAVLLDRRGRARRGDVELHLRPAGWRAHGHDGDPAYAGVALHVVGADGGGAGNGAGSGSPPLALLPPAPAGTEPRDPPCERLPATAAPELGRLLERLALARLRRKLLRDRRRIAELGPDRAAAASLAHALGGPANGAVLEAALRSVPPADGGAAEPAVEQLEAALSGAAWRRGRGPAGTRRGAAAALAALLAKAAAAGEGAGDAGGWALRIALSGAAGARGLLAPGLIGPARAARLAGDFAAPFALAAAASGPAERARIAELWLDGPDDRHLRTAALRARVAAAAPESGRRARAQALLDLEAGWCAHGACAVCPLGALAGPPPPRRPGLPRPPVPSPNRPRDQAAGEKTSGPEVL